MTEIEIMAYEDKLLEAMKNADVAVLSSLLHDDLLFNVFDGSTITKSMDLQSYESANMSLTDYEIIYRQIKLFGDTVVATLIVEMNGKMQGQEFQSVVNFIRTWKKFDGGWKVIAGASATVNP